ncbi:MAG: CoA-binding protein, partial [Oleibacter sp.]|nr:CoA-binding protein [Thalassolituus sp.]
MGTRSLESFFSPKSIVIVGASEREGSLGGAIMRNLTEGGYEGEILPLNTNDYDTVYGIKSFHRVSDLPSVPDLAIICTPAVSVPRVIKQLHALGVVAAMILTGGIARARSWQFRPDSARINSVIKRTRMRILGPDCLGMVVPSRKLNASLLHVPVHSGHMAYVGQSGTLASGVMDWAYSRQIGFSHVVTLGRSDDVTLPDLIDYIAQEPSVRTLLVQIDEIRSGRALVRSLRAASRHKLVLAVKNNRFSESPLTTIAQPKGILHRDLLVDEVFNRAGVLRVNATDELFDCVDALGSRRERFGARLAIIANGRGPAILAMDRLLHDKGQLAELDDKTIQSLKAILPEYIQAQNPVLLNPEIAPEQLSAVGQILIKDSSVDAILFVYSPSLGANPDANAKAVVELASGTRKTILTSWMGEYSVEKARDAFDKARIPTFDTPDNAVKSYMYMVRHQRTQDLLRETPESIEIPFVISQEELQEKVFKSLKPGDFMPP